MHTSGSGTSSTPSNGALRRAAVGPLIALYNLLLFALVNRPAYIPNEKFPWIDELERNWKTVRDELDELLDHGPEVPPFHLADPSQKKLWSAVGRILRPFAPQDDGNSVDLDKWRTFYFRMYGRDVVPNRELCPQTAELLDQVPGLTAAMFSVLEPDVRLPSHFGLFAGAYRMHLGLRIPPGGRTAIRVGGINKEWEEGEAFVFEHTRWHTAWNYADEPRVVLILDFERPMPWRWLARLNHRVVSALGESAKARDAVAHIESLTPPVS